MSRPASSLRAGKAHVAVVAAALDEIQLAAAFDVLSPSERTRALGFKLPARIDEFIKTRAVLRWALAWRTGRDPRSFDIRDAESGAPCLADEPDLFCNVSHSAGQALVSVAHAPLGIDIELMRADVDCLAIAQACYHPHERTVVQGTDGNGRIEAFFDIWTRKEAYLKATGTGLSAELTGFSTVAANGAVSDGGTHGIWHVQPLSAPIGYRAALATRPGNPRLVRLRCSGTGAIHQEPQRAAA
ncbi:MAG TPA: 4'-phosphopantetheinyl transferase superfamily protein [Hyphomicrobiaceae bacterium]|nr:4'-phosphopantetheinyl transferase superfamily protein [Hyphomicrobiaceae bacterium]